MAKASEKAPDVTEVAGEDGAFQDAEGDTWLTVEGAKARFKTATAGPDRPEGIDLQPLPDRSVIEAEPDLGYAAFVGLMADSYRDPDQPDRVLVPEGGVRRLPPINFRILYPPESDVPFDPDEWLEWKGVPDKLRWPLAFFAYQRQDEVWHPAPSKAAARKAIGKIGRKLEELEAAWWELDGALRRVDSSWAFETYKIRQLVDAEEETVAALPDPPSGRVENEARTALFRQLRGAGLTNEQIALFLIRYRMVRRRLQYGEHELWNLRRVKQNVDEKLKPSRRRKRSG